MTRAVYSVDVSAGSRGKPVAAADVSRPSHAATMALRGSPVSSRSMPARAPASSSSGTSGASNTGSTCRTTCGRRSRAMTTWASTASTPIATSATTTWMSRPQSGDGVLGVTFLNEVTGETGDVEGGTVVVGTSEIDTVATGRERTGTEGPVAATTSATATTTTATAAATVPRLDMRSGYSR